jgi:hypothetical protein
MKVWQDEILKHDKQDLEYLTNINTNLFLENMEKIFYLIKYSS